MKKIQKSSSRKARDESVRPAFDSVKFAGVGLIEKHGKGKVLVIYSSIKDAINHGVARKVAQNLFAGALGSCDTDFSIFGNVSCSSTNCTGKCDLQRWDPTTKSWVSQGSGKAPAGALTWRCECV